MAKILLVEDDKSLREIYGVRLQAEGYEIVSAGDGEEALATAIKERPDLIVSDVMMPKISGFDMLDILRSTAETKDIKVIMMTALSSDDQRARGESLGADRYLVKSQVGIEDVVRTVHDVLGDGVPGAVAAAPATPAPETPLPTPDAPVQPTPTPITPEPTPSVAPSVPPAPAEPVIAPIAPVPAPTPAPITPATSATPPVINTPPETPTPVVPPVPSTPVLDTPVTPPTPVQPAPMAPTPLPEPTAPFSSPAPASLGDRIIAPLNPVDVAAPTDIAAQMNAELNAVLPPPASTTPSTPPLPPPPVPATPPLPPAPGSSL